MADFDAIVLAGGAGRRLGGVDKAAIDVGRMTLLDRALAAVDGARSVVVVGPERPLPVGVQITCEEPAGGGPVAAIEAGLAVVTQPLVVVLACDMPLVGAQRVRRLIDVLVSAEHADTAVALYVERGRRQPLAAAYRVDPLREAMASLSPTHGRAVRDLVGLLTVAEIPADAGSTADVDTWDDVARSRTLLED
jgi:molybdopterin-guanine dinucleotide biosynthesis protein A